MPLFSPSSLHLPLLLFTFIRIPLALSCLLPGACAPPPIYCRPLCSLSLFPLRVFSFTYPLSALCLPLALCPSSPAFGLMPPLRLWYTLAPSIPSLILAPSCCPVLLTYSLADVLQAGWQVSRDRVPLFCLVTRDPPARPPSVCSLALSPPNVGSVHLTASYLGAALWGGPDWVHSVKQSNKARLGGQETAPPHPRACGVGRMVPPPPILVPVRLWPYPQTALPCSLAAWLLLAVTHI